MSLVVGFGPEGGGRGGLSLGALLARSATTSLTVCCVVPDRWATPGPGRVDAEYTDYLSGLAQGALDQAREEIEETVPAEYVVRTGRSVPAVLLRECKERQARLLVVGSSGDGPWGHVALGSVSSRLLHSADIPLALAPRGFRAGADEVVQRVTVALDGTPSCGPVLLTAARVAREVDAHLRVMTFAVRGRRMYPPEVGLHAEDAVMSVWREQAEAALQASVAELATHDDVATPDETSIVDGRDWRDTLDRVVWDDGDVLAVGSSQDGPVARVFLGSTASRIIRHSPVPVVVLPRAR